MRILVLATNYASIELPAALTYIHSRNILYKKYHMEITVLNFSAKKSYQLDEIDVITKRDYISSGKKYDLLISHAPNIRNHYRFLKEYENRFEKIVFFFHGHEVLITSKVYSKPFYYVKKKIIDQLITEIYDRIKIQIWRKYLKKLAIKSQFIFVSKWMHEEFCKATGLADGDLLEHVYITYNCVGAYFELNKYDRNSEKKYDFITIRSYLDNSKYGVDIVIDIAEKNPDKSFLLVGKGEIFKYYKKPNNLVWLDKNCDHEEIANLLNQSKCALMPTRTDAQGVMACEMATFGIPLITSDLPVCHEVFSEFDNVTYITNGSDEFDIIKKYNSIKNNYSSNKYYSENTIANEIKIFQENAI